MSKVIAATSNVRAHSFAVLYDERSGDLKRLLKVCAFILAHVPLAFLAHTSSRVATAHALATVTIGLWFVIFTQRGAERAAYVVTYIAGAEVFWRMTNASIFWEFGKYSIALILLTAVLRWGLFKGAFLPLLYLLLLLPSTVLTISAQDWETARKDLSFNLSGPLALAMSAWFFSQIRFSIRQLKRLLIALIAPLSGVAFLTIFFAVTTEISFGGNSNKSVTGGFGPNQVSAALGLGVLATLLCILIGKSDLKYKALMFAMALLFAMQSALTFSRGGLYNAAAGSVLALICLSRDAPSRTKVIVLAITIFCVANFVLLPYLNHFTRGALVNRFQSTNTTGRGQIAEDDLNIWAQNPVLGVGPGQAAHMRIEAEEGLAAHTELTRLLAEHGALGFIALLVIFVVIAQRWLTAQSIIGKAVIAAAAGWSLIFMLNAAMRLAAPSVMFGLCLLTIRSTLTLRLRSHNMPRRYPNSALVQKRQLAAKQL